MSKYVVISGLNTGNNDVFGHFSRSAFFYTFETIFGRNVFILPKMTSASPSPPAPQKKITASTAKYKAHSQFLLTKFKNIYTFLIHILILRANYYLIPVFNVFVVVVNVFITLNLRYEMNKLSL